LRFLREKLVSFRKIFQSFAPLIKGERGISCLATREKTAYNLINPPFPLSQGGENVILPQH
jgi:hypothetical protein